MIEVGIFFCGTSVERHFCRGLRILSINDLVFLFQIRETEALSPRGRLIKLLFAITEYTFGLSDKRLMMIRHEISLMLSNFMCHPKTRLSHKCKMQRPREHDLDSVHSDRFHFSVPDGIISFKYFHPSYSTCYRNIDITSTKWMNFFTKLSNCLRIGLTH